MDFLFPFNIVSRESNIVLYGLGNVGEDYYREIEITNWCKIVAVVDKYKTGLFHDITIYNSMENVTCTFDYVVIAINDKWIASEEYYSLLSEGISCNKIIHMCLQNDEGFFSINEINERQKKLENEINSDKTNVALILEGGLGDCIVHESVYEALMNYDRNIRVYVFAVKAFAQTVFCSKENVVVGDITTFNRDIQYDLVMRLRLCIYIEKISSVLQKKSLWLYQKIQHYDASSALFEMAHSIERDAVLVNRALILKKNRYSFLGGNLFDLSEDMVEILQEKISEIEEQRVDNLQKYVTINFGADQRVIQYKGLQVKIWPYEYYSKLVELLHIEYPTLKIVQLATKDIPKINNVDMILRNESLGIVKLYLKKSLLHIDCEGGLVHMASQLGTKCIVLFGPTSESFYGYRKNINISMNECRGCMGNTANWFISCARGYKNPKCMYDILPEKVFAAIKEYFGGN